MKVEVGQDATGRWAWLIRESDGVIIDSDDDYPTAERALEFGLYRARKREGKRASE